MLCETCAYYGYDEEEEEWYCEADIDQDDYEMICRRGWERCPFWRNGDEYAVVRKQC